MNPLFKLAGFAAVLALAFGGAAFAGSALDVRAAKPEPEADGDGGRARQAAARPRPGGQRPRA